jgi:hypothetical protein
LLQRSIQPQGRVPCLPQRSGHAELPRAVRPDQSMIGQHFQHGVQFASGFVVRRPQQLRQSITRRGRTQRRQRLGHLEVRQGEQRQGQRHGSRALKPVRQFPHRAGLEGTWRLFAL